jgi:hypothetical protein
LFNGVKKHGVINLTLEHEEIAIIRRLEAYCFQDRDTTIDLCNTSLNSGIC